MKELTVKRLIFENKYTFLRHLIYWTLIFLIVPLIDISTHYTAKEAYETCAIMLPSCIIYTYGIIYWLLPKYLLKERYTWFFFLVIAWASINMLLTFASRYYILVPLRESRPPPPIQLNRAYKEVINIFSFVIGNSMAMLAVFLKIFKSWYIKQQQALQLVSEKLTTELQLLKVQLHPHFLFNTLNSLYSLVLIKSDKSADVLLKISGLLSYMLYDCNAPQVPLDNEIKALEDYIYLEKERYGDRLEISIHISGDIYGKTIAPLLMLPLVENSFKHGASGQLNNAWISMDLSLKNNILRLNLLNSKNEGTHLTDHQGIGISNLKKRLELIYPEKHEMRMGDEGELFYVALTVVLDKAPSTQSLSKHDELTEVMI